MRARGGGRNRGGYVCGIDKRPMSNGASHEPSIPNQRCACACVRPRRTESIGMRSLVEPTDSGAGSFSAAGTKRRIRRPVRPLQPGTPRAVLRYMVKKKSRVAARNKRFILSVASGALAAGCAQVTHETSDAAHGGGGAPSDGFDHGPVTGTVVMPPGTMSNPNGPVAGQPVAVGTVVAPGAGAGAPPPMTPDTVFPGAGSGAVPPVMTPPIGTSVWMPDAELQDGGADD
jgi:hypothetical protein